MHVGPRSGATHHAVQTRGGGGGIGGRDGDGPVVFALLRARVGRSEHRDPRPAEIGDANADDAVARAEREGTGAVLDVAEPREGVSRGNGDPAAVQHASSVGEVVLGEFETLFREELGRVLDAGNERGRRRVPHHDEGLALARARHGGALELHHLSLRARVGEDAEHAGRGERGDPRGARGEARGAFARGERHAPLGSVRPGLVRTVEDGRGASLGLARGRERAAALAQDADVVPVVIGDCRDATRAGGVVERHLDAVEIAASLAGGDDGAHHVVAQETAGDARGGVAVVLAA